MPSHENDGIFIVLNFFPLKKRLAHKQAVFVFILF